MLVGVGQVGGDVGAGAVGGDEVGVAEVVEDLAGVLAEGRGEGADDDDAGGGEAGDAGGGFFVVGGGELVGGQVPG